MKFKMNKYSVLMICAISFFNGGVIGEEAKKTAVPNFRFALPENYSVTEHVITPEYNGGSVTLFPKVDSESMEGGPSEKIIRVQTFLSKFYSKDLLVLRDEDPNGFLKKLVESQLATYCSDFEYDSGRVRKRKNDTRINWWTHCNVNGEVGKHEYERGRMFLSDTGAYLLSHVNRNSDPKHRFTTSEKKWFDTYLYSSRFCISGENCGEEGALISDIFEAKSAGTN